MRREKMGGTYGVVVLKGSHALIEGSDLVQQGDLDFFRGVRTRGIANIFGLEELVGGGCDGILTTMGDGVKEGVVLQTDIVWELSQFVSSGPDAGGLRRGYGQRRG